MPEVFVVKTMWREQTLQKEFRTSDRRHGGDYGADPAILGPTMNISQYRRVQARPAIC